MKKLISYKLFYHAVVITLIVDVSDLRAQEIVQNSIQKSETSVANQLLDDITVKGNASSMAEDIVSEVASWQKTADEGIHIEIESVANASGKKDDGGYIRIYSPWPAKPMSKAPEGWKYIPAPTQLQAYSQKIKLANGASVDLAITPFTLVPISDGLNVIRIVEPGYEPALDFSQKNTIGTMLQNSTSDIEENEKQASKAISLLQQLLSSLPQKKQ